MKLHLLLYGNVLEIRIDLTDCQSSNDSDEVDSNRILFQNQQGNFRYLSFYPFSSYSRFIPAALWLVMELWIFDLPEKLNGQSFFDRVKYYVYETYLKIFTLPFFFCFSSFFLWALHSLPPFPNFSQMNLKGATNAIYLCNKCNRWLVLLYLFPVLTMSYPKGCKDQVFKLLAHTLAYHDCLLSMTQ